MLVLSRIAQRVRVVKQVDSNDVYSLYGRLFAIPVPRGMSSSGKF